MSAGQLRLVVAVVAVAGILAAAIGLVAVFWGIGWPWGVLAAGLSAAILGSSAYSVIREWQ